MQIASDIAIPIAICLASQVDVLLAATARAAYDRSTGRTPMTVPASPPGNRDSPRLAGGRCARGCGRRPSATCLVRQTASRFPG